ncbi:MAG: protein-L-isoaspartate O-methyltransferase, partial [Cupriavidus basilensis]|nr:protein-L-isoaspartate O-methyltransferase [Cupriavidus basilensis]
MSSVPRRPKFPLSLDAVVERKPAPARTAGMPAVGGARGAAMAAKSRSAKAPAAPTAAACAVQA